MNKIFNKKVNIVLSAVLVVVCLMLTLQAVLANGAVKNSDEMITSAKPIYAASPDIASAEPTTEPTTQQETTAEPTTKPIINEKAESKKKTEETTEPPTTEPPTTQEPTVAFATAVPAEKPASHKAQLDAGYLIAIDNPDLSYECAQVTLSDYDRDLLERLCMGEFGVGGFTGAALIAQAVKNAICFDGFRSVQSVIDECRYTGRTDIPANESCKRAVRYIFDENHDAVQHRLLYMYNPSLVQSSFHESQNYILTYDGVRFFDRWR